MIFRYRGARHFDVAYCFRGERGESSFRFQAEMSRLSAFSCRRMQKVRVGGGRRRRRSKSRHESRITNLTTEWAAFF